MDLKTVLFLSNAIAAFFIAYVTGYQKRAVVIPSCVVGISLSVYVFGKSGEIVGFIVYFLLAFFIYGLGALAGSLLGVRLHATATGMQKSVSRLWLKIGIAIVIAGIVIAAIINERNNAKWSSVGESLAMAFVQQQNEVLSKTGKINSSFLTAKGNNASGIHIFIYSVKGDKGEVHATVEVSGSVDTPVFSIKTIEINANPPIKQNAPQLRHPLP